MQVDSKPTTSPLSRETGFEKQRSINRGGGAGVGDNEWLLSRLRAVRREARLRKAPHPAFGHLPPGGEGPDASRLKTDNVSPLPRDRL
jgi:hypothetical protein